ncbi:lysoplasmalogenase [Echinicola jeungdonensis]|uniref:Lysoplasmalogenase n=1 Tax=Echinicola jeungdonensis TaxID=709343 RepID=A0ABV5J466_9BACT|nr:lysoplasmalogenase [Echinicola jeungdonensis]MDN3669323.1 lysoplasmalogenase [Echinicola jeungdonensis]
MLKKEIIWLYLYLFAGLADMAMIIQQIDAYRIFTKPLILISLTIYFFTSTRLIKNSLLRKSMGTALIFLLAGDILKLFPSYFWLGWGAYLITQICYIIAFKLTQSHTIQLKGMNFVKLFFYNLPIYILAAFLYYLINDQLNQLKTPIIIYILTMVLMVSIARERYKRTNILSYSQVFLGALLFMISDSIQALDIFFRPIPSDEVLVRGTFTLAHLLIVMGIRSHLIHGPITKK